MTRKPAPCSASRTGVEPEPSSWVPSALSTVIRPSEPRRAASASASAAGAEPVGVVGPGEQGPAAALDVEGQLAVDQDHQGAGLAARAVAAVARGGQGQRAAP